MICILSLIDALSNDFTLSSCRRLVGIPCDLSPLIFIFKVHQATHGGIKEEVEARKERSKADSGSEKVLFPEFLWSVTQSALGVAIPRAPGNSVRDAWGVGRPGEHLCSPGVPRQVLVALETTEGSTPALVYWTPQSDPHTVQSQGSRGCRCALEAKAAS